MKTSKRVLINILALILFFIFTPSGVFTSEMPCEPEPVSEPEPRVFIALGDSVPAGFGVASHERYTAMLFEMLREGDYIDKYVNMAEDGFTATALLRFLNNLDEYDFALFQDAYVITLNIGGNDLLNPLINYLPTQEDVMGMILEIWDFIQESMLLVSEVMEIASELQYTLENFNPWRLWEIPLLIGMAQDAAPVLGEVTGMMDAVSELQLFGLLPMLQGEFSPELNAMLINGVANFDYEFNQILSWLNTHAPGAVVIINTVYNPIPTVLFGMSFDGLSARADVLVQAINGIILENGEANGFLVADVFTSFANEADNVMNFFVDAPALTFSFDIIHPNAAGHELIAAINYELLVPRLR